MRSQKKTFEKFKTSEFGLPNLKALVAEFECNSEIDGEPITKPSRCNIREEENQALEITVSP